MSNEMTDARVKMLLREMDKIVRRDEGEPVWLDPVGAAHITVCLRGEVAQGEQAVGEVFSEDHKFCEGYKTWDIRVLPSVDLSVLGEGAKLYTRPQSAASAKGHEA